ncbi:hypothetical protein BJ973_003995 [Actinoplanes tereljensis]|uniref:Uncharacterized protein n=1 Tax=Paractinoplanes tereljensis TaxID=571912 RepID=A0A919NVX6_9ACTN|nr:hypothetical protein [Actinoplanes tereljensis]GIF25718.1 hypothetical protein Ate02nite_84480 [Actinoplanes tereljensis]
MCISATATAETGVTLSIHLSHGTVFVALDERSVARLLTFFEAPIIFTVGTIRVDASGHYPALAGPCLHTKQFPVTGLTLERSADGYTLHANLAKGNFGRPDGRSPALYTVPAKELHRLLTTAGGR